MLTVARADHSLRFSLADIDRVLRSPIPEMAAFHESVCAVRDFEQRNPELRPKPQGQVTTLRFA
jgi:hypothetical protein